ncbi:VapE domain-containing protein (plasmid) [Cyanobacterium aponinum AL20118]|uniref:VapE family protein n=1 Tax=Cyanobacterium aponinum AL20115 TaxID=3090662 RepID=A0AAF0ZHB5_9CHRO|nr:VapE domain-containing protein [Cyanobacterium aponinum]WPF90508.1 VapE family protein [Cyanobacterium aponinum AL20115]
MIPEKELLKAIDSVNLAIEPVIGELVSKEMIPLWESEAAARDEGKKHTISLDYGKFHKVDRVINYYEGNVKKDCYPKHLKENKWIKKLPEDRSLFPLYHEDKISFAKGKWLLIHEGEKACDYALSRSFISVSLCGSLANDDDYIKGKLLLIKELGVKGIVYFADNDDAGIKKAIKIRDKALEIGFPLVIVPISKILWDAKKGDDFKEYSDKFPHHDGEMLKAQIESIIIENKFDLINIKDESKTNVHSDLKSKQAKKESKKEEVDSIALARDILLNHYQDRLKYNELKMIVELDGEEAILDDFYLTLHEDYNLQIGKTVAYDLAVRFAKKNSFNPVKDYLESLTKDDEKIDIKQLSSKLFGTEDPIYDEFLYRFLIASVARIYKHGCKSDHCLILKGNQGIGKSTFFKLLYGEEFFTDSVTGTDRDNLLVAHQNWFCELAEFETITSKKASGELKAFVSKSDDTFREPYAKSTRTIKRKFVIGGSVNEDTFLVDSTGNRRYLIIPIDQEINLEFIKKYRDVIWYQAKLAYQSGERWYLDKSSQALSEKLNKSYLHHDSWDSPELEGWLSLKTKGVSTREILTQFLGVSEKDINKGHEMRLGKIMKGNGWINKQMMINGKRQRLWIINDDYSTYINLTTQPQLDEQEMSTPGSQPQQGITQPTQPTHLKSLNFETKDETIDSKGFVDAQESLPKIDEYDEYHESMKSQQGFQNYSTSTQPEEKIENQMSNDSYELDFAEAKKEINKLFDQLGMSTKEERLNFVRDLFGGEVTNFYSLTNKQIEELFVTLQSLV